jgi:hypothetical protein
MSEGSWRHTLIRALRCEACRRYRLGLSVVLALALIAWWLG